jgi:Kyakuja-Dileera-Zisupton transposase
VIVNQLIDILVPGIGCAYDIGCTFLQMVENSGLSEKVKNALFWLMVGVFHVHAHNCMC